MASTSSASSRVDDLSCLVLFQPVDGPPPQAIMHPFREDDIPLLVSLDHSAITSKSMDDPARDSCRLVFQPQLDNDDHPVKSDLVNNSCLVWSDSQGKNAIHSRRVLLHILKAIDRNGKKLVASGDLYSTQQTAGTLFFQPKAEPDKDNDKDTEICCIGFHGYDKLRLYDVPADLRDGLVGVMSRNWKYGMEERDGNNEKYAGVPEYKLKEMPWNTLETNNDHNLASRKLIMSILDYMRYSGNYHTVIPVDCFVKGFLGMAQGDMDSLVFYRNVRRDDQRVVPVEGASPPASSLPSQGEWICLCMEKYTSYV